MFDPPVFKELAAIQEGIDFFPNPNDSDFETCRARNKDSTRRCGILPCKFEQRAEVANLLSEFRYMTECIDTISFYNKMERFIDLTHCSRYHLPKAKKAFSKWKTQRTAAPSTPLSIPLKKVVSYSDSLESLSETSSVTSLSFTSDSSKYSESAADFHSRAKLKSPKATSTAQSAVREIHNSFADKTQEQKERFKKLGKVTLPRVDEQQDHAVIYTTIKNLPHPDRMSKGVLYILEHTEISGILKIGWTKTSAEKRRRQSDNCYGANTRILYETKGGKFIGAFQAERIAHAILRHKNIHVNECPYCGGAHKEWFLVSRREAFEVVKIAESWLQMPAYTLDQGVYKLSPKGESRYKAMFHFSVDQMKGSINNDDELDSAPGAFSGAKLAAAVQEVNAPNSSLLATESKSPKGRIDRSSTTILPIRQQPREKAPVRADGGKKMTNSTEANELAEEYPTRSLKSDPNVEYDQVAGREFKMSWHHEIWGIRHGFEVKISNK
ncbi:hypothetical protein ACHAQJ_000493 [Trichoderma viride]